MFDQPNEICVPEVSNDGEKRVPGRGSSFKKIRKLRKKIRLERQLGERKGLGHKKLTLSGMEKDSSGPTKQTVAKLTPDPLILFRKKNILNDEQIWAFEQIKRAVQIITDGTQIRTSRFNAVVVQSSRSAPQYESEYEVRVKEHYTNWIDRMTYERQKAGPVLDIIIDEMSLTAVDRKWGKRKGWARDLLRTSLDLYGVFSSANDRYK
ncbi:MAG: hypothetical protein JKY45_00410 [Emcibacter sp.]|nr:hypothetical protein [Emcibacter sp.]